MTDGNRCQFIVFNEIVKSIYEIDKTKVEPDSGVRKLDSEMVDRLIRSIINLQVKALNQIILFMIW